MELGTEVDVAVARQEVLAELEALLARAIDAVGPFSAANLDGAGQRATHGLAWLAATVAAIRELTAWSGRLREEGREGPLEAAIAAVGVGEYLAQIRGGIPMSQIEMVRLGDLGLRRDDAAFLDSDPAASLIAVATSAEARAEIVRAILERNIDEPSGDAGLDDTLAAFAAEIGRFTDERISPHANRWHRENALIPDVELAALAELGVFALTLPEAYGGLGLGKSAMCVVSEELSRGYLGVGSLGTRSEIAGELILSSGTNAQKSEWLPRIADGSVLPTAVFTEPDFGSDLASIRTRAARDGNTWRITGSKTWITHAARADLMTLLARTDPDEPGHRGLSIFIAPKPRGTDADPFPAAGMSGSEIDVIGYRGMREYELSFDGFQVPEEGLLGGVEGEGFRQLMRTFESARIQTAGRATGVAEAALRLALAYATERRQFGRPLIEFARVADKIAMMAVETQTARQMTLYAARQKDSGARCDLEAGMAKLLAARVAWSNADNCVQIHGGNGFAIEFEASRLLCDARILSIFEGAAEIQAEVISRRLLE